MPALGRFVVVCTDENCCL